MSRPHPHPRPRHPVGLGRGLRVSVLLGVLASTQSCGQTSQAGEVGAVAPNDAAATGDSFAPGDGAASADAAPVDTNAPLLAAGESVELVTNSAYLSRALDVIHTAQTRLDIVQFEYKPGTVTDILVEAIKKARKRGVKVRVLVDDEITENAKLVAALRAADVSSRLDDSSIRTHAKLIYSDQAFLVGSTNWSTTSITNNNETNVLVRDPGARLAMGGWIEAVWKNANAAVPISASAAKDTACYGDGGFADAAAAILDGAKKRLDVITYAMTYDPKFTTGPLTASLDRLKKAVARGVTVRVLLDQSPPGWSVEGGAAANFEAAKYLKSIGVQVRMDKLDTITHAKVVVTDAALVVGTNNWGYYGMAVNHEIGVRSTHPGAVTALQKYFDGLWAQGVVP